MGFLARCSWLSRAGSRTDYRLSSSPRKTFGTRTAGKETQRRSITLATLSFVQYGFARVQKEKVAAGIISDLITINLD